jgi:hypothetical protein
MCAVTPRELLLAKLDALGERGPESTENQKAQVRKNEQQ